MSETSTPASTSTSATTLGNKTLNLADEVKKYNTAQDYQTHEIQDINKHFKHCILFRMENYGSLVVYKLESIHLMSKELTMIPEHEKIGDESSGEYTNNIYPRDLFASQKTRSGVVSSKILSKISSNSRVRTKQSGENEKRDDDGFHYPYESLRNPPHHRINKKALDKGSEEYQTLRNSVNKVWARSLG
ncbi:hypothetical protein RhiirA1_466183 [Rhizophagus irregularis]|uniref:Uncharacterized protein n=1 Tax=Rhizophagus irregularis TaxID=588596 RepID=A0A2N0REE5_9GLOM|nr:hypothetical protein RhiirA1_466183 [Rhizophagus irregularis]